MVGVPKGSPLDRVSMESGQRDLRGVSLLPHEDDGQLYALEWVEDLQ